MDPALLFAIFRRLTGYPLDSQGRPLVDDKGLPQNRDGKFGLRIPAKKSTTSGPISPQGTATPEAWRFGTRGYEPNNYVQVPVHAEGIDTKRWETVFPSASFTISDVQPGGDPYIYDPHDGEDGIGQDSGTATVTNPVTGYTMAVPDHRTVRANPEPWDVYVTVSLYARDIFQMAHLERALLVLFPQKGAIDVEQLDGTFRTLDCFFVRYSVMDQGEPYDPVEGVGPQGDSFVKRAYTWKIETSLDNSVSGFGTYDFVTQQMILQRIVDLETMQQKLIEQVQLEEFLP